MAAAAAMEMAAAAVVARSDRRNQHSHFQTRNHHTPTPLHHHRTSHRLRKCTVQRSREVATAVAGQQVMVTGEAMAVLWEAVETVETVGGGSDLVAMVAEPGRIDRRSLRNRYRIRNHCT